jgi:hypothetical protein
MELERTEKGGTQQKRTANFDRRSVRWIDTIVAQGPNVDIGGDDNRGVDKPWAEKAISLAFFGHFLQFGIQFGGLNIVPYDLAFGVDEQNGRQGLDAQSIGQTATFQSAWLEQLRPR